MTYDNNYVNESTILKILTDAWIIHDDKIDREIDPDEKRNLIKSRKIISEILAMEQYVSNKPIGKDAIRKKVSENFDTNVDAKKRLEEYYVDAITSTFLTKEENDTFQFILQPVLEYFIARRIVTDLKNNDILQLREDIKKIKSKEVFNFIQGISFSEWSITSNFLTEIKDNSIHDSLFENKVVCELFDNNIDHREKLIEIIMNYRSLKSDENVGNFLKILHITGGIPPEPNFSDLHMSSVDIGNVNIHRSNLQNSFLNGGNFHGADMSESRLHNANLSNAVLSGVNFNHAKLFSTNFFTSILKGATFRDAKLDIGEKGIPTNLQLTKMHAVLLDNASLVGANLKKSELFKSELTNTNLSNTDLTETDFTGAFLNNVQLSNSSMIKTILNFATIENVDFTKAKIISQIKLRGVDLTSCVLECLNLNGSDLRDSNLNGLNLTDVKLGAKLQNADMSNTMLSNTDFRGANLHGVKFHNARYMERSILTDVDIRHAEGIPLKTHVLRKMGAIID